MQSSRSKPWAHNTGCGDGADESSCLPGWNPMRVVQRHGRIDRIGSTFLRDSDIKYATAISNGGYSLPDQDPRKSQGRRARRMILPGGGAGEISKKGHLARGFRGRPAGCGPWFWSSAASLSDGSVPARSTTNAAGACPRISSGTPTTAHIATAGWAIRLSSISPDRSDTPLR